MADIKEALEKLDLIIEMFNKYANKPNDISEFFKFTKAHEIVKQALQQAEIDKKKARAFDVIKEKYVDVWLLQQCDYKNYIRIRKKAKIEDELTKEEFELLKEVLNNEK